MLTFNSPVVKLWMDELSSWKLTLFFISCLLLLSGLKILVTHLLMSHVQNLYQKDLIDSKNDDLDKDVVERLSSIERYTILRSNSVVQL